MQARIFQTISVIFVQIVKDKLGKVNIIISLKVVYIAISQQIIVKK